MIEVRDRSQFESSKNMMEEDDEKSVIEFFGILEEMKAIEDAMVKHQHQKKKNLNDAETKTRKVVEELTQKSHAQQVELQVNSNSHII